MDFDDIEAYLANLEQGYLSEVGNPSLACGVMIFEFCANPSDWQLKCWRFREWFGLGSFVFSTLEREPSPSRGIQGWHSESTAPAQLEEAFWVSS